MNIPRGSGVTRVKFCPDLGISAVGRNFYISSFTSTYAFKQGSVLRLVEKWETRHHPALKGKNKKPPAKAVTGDDAMKNNNSDGFVKEEFGPDTMEFGGIRGQFSTRQARPMTYETDVG